mmetsp:Transcript_9760/g.23262  ORF Transcript_9760/g.23262 Transcript_9760/m.23262 type:complete len:240 (-) Transcript_9760:438-1157(-)
MTAPSLGWVCARCWLPARCRTWSSAASRLQTARGMPRSHCLGALVVVDRGRSHAEMLRRARVPMVLDVKHSRVSCRPQSPRVLLPPLVLWRPAPARRQWWPRCRPRDPCPRQHTVPRTLARARKITAGRTAVQSVFWSSVASGIPCRSLAAATRCAMSATKSPRVACVSSVATIVRPGLPCSRRHPPWRRAAPTSSHSRTRSHWLEQSRSGTWSVKGSPGKRFRTRRGQLRKRPQALRL